jgi:hypothetical protein
MDELELSYDDEDAIPAEYRKLYTEKDGKWTFGAIKGLATDSRTPGLEKALKTEREANKKLKADLAKVKDINLDTLHDDMAELEELRVLKESGGGKPDDATIARLVDAQVTRKTAGLTRENLALKEKLGTAESRAAELETGIKRSKISDAARTAAAKAKVVPEAMDDVLLYAEKLFDVDESGAITARDNVGVTPGIDIEAWISDRVKDRPHWFPRTNGGGSRGDLGSGNRSANPWSKAGWSLAAQGEVVKAKGEAAARQMAEAAGSKLGATRPPDN